MSIVTEIERIKTNIANAYTTCEEKGAILPSILNSANLADCISSVTGGGVNIDSGYVTDGLLLHLSGLRKPISNIWIDDLREKAALLYNSATYDVNNKCYSLNGINQYGRIDVDGIASGDFTFECYYKQDNIGVFDLLVGTERGAKKGYGLLNNDGKHYCWIYNTSALTLPSADRLEQIAGRKVYSAISRDSATMFFDLKDIERNVVKSYAGVSNDLRVSQLIIGRNVSVVEAGDNVLYSKANIYAIRAYNRKLTDEEIQQNYNQDVLNYGA